MAKATYDLCSTYKSIFMENTVSGPDLGCQESISLKSVLLLDSEFPLQSSLPTESLLALLAQAKIKELDLQSTSVSSYTYQKKSNKWFLHDSISADSKLCVHNLK